MVRFLHHSPFIKGYTMALVHADELRKLAPISVDKALERLNESLVACAKNGRTNCRTTIDHKHDQELWVYGGYTPTEDWKEAKKKLEASGYKVTFYYSDGLMITTMYTIISW